MYHISETKNSSNGYGNLYGSLSLFLRIEAVNDIKKN